MEQPFYELAGFASWGSFFATNAVVHVLDAIVCVLIARNRGRDPKRWFALGLLGGFVTLAVILLLPAPKAFGSRMWRREGGAAA